MTLMTDRKTKRKLMDGAIKTLVIPFLREQGFKGSMPHFRRIKKDRINLITFQHSRHQTKFVVEIANCPPSGITTYWDEVIPEKRVTAQDVSRRLRLGSTGVGTDYWFDYTKESIFTNTYRRVAKEVLSNWEQAEKWWEENPFEQENEG